MRVIPRSFQTTVRGSEWRAISRKHPLHPCSWWEAQASGSQSGRIFQATRGPPYRHDWWSDGKELSTGRWEYSDI
eukprot:6589518-Pyramimonas_sp.AAC.1